MAAHQFTPVSRLAFLAAMQKAFRWNLSLPENAVEALLGTDAFERILSENQPAHGSTLSPKDYDAAHFEAFANDPRGQFLSIIT